MIRRTLVPVLLCAAALSATPASAGTITFGDRDCLNQNCYGASDPTAGATLQGLSAGAITTATNSFTHGFPISVAPGDFAGTDQAFVGSVLTFADDGYAASAARLNGPQVLTLDYSSLITGGQVLDSLTLGIAADDFQAPFFHQPFSATINGVSDAALTAQLNAIEDGGPSVQFFTIGLNPNVDSGNHILTLAINEGGNGGDGWAVDFLTIGATTHAETASPVPEPASITLVALGIGAMVARRRDRRSPSRRPGL